MKTKNGFNTAKMVQLALFTAIIVLMAFTPLGYIKTPGLTITLLVVPVTVGAIVLGPTSGAILGGIFGITSFIQCFGADPLGVALLDINPIGTFILTMLPRILMGWLTGLIFIGIRKFDKAKGISHAAASLAGPLLNTILFMSTLVLIFYNAAPIRQFAESKNAKNAFTLIVALVSVNALIEAATCFVIGTAISKTLDIIARRYAANQK